MRRPSHGVRPISNATTFAIVIVGAPYGEGDMPDARYFVERLKAHSDAWMIKFDLEKYGPYKTQSEAVLFAIEAAEKRNEHGEKAQIVIIGPTWAHDQDISRGSW
jgi:hypothetical protein